jgi:hypothetical protein
MTNVRRMHVGWDGDGMPREWDPDGIPAGAEGKNGHRREAQEGRGAPRLPRVMNATLEGKKWVLTLAKNPRSKVMTHMSMIR